MFSNPTGINGARSLIGRTGVQIFFLFLTLYVITSPGGIVTSDGMWRFRIARQILNEGTVSFPSPDEDKHLFQGTNGKWYSLYQLGQPLIELPFLIAGIFIAEITGNKEWIERDDMPAATFLISVILFPLLSAGMVLGIFCFLRLLGHSERVSGLTSLLFGSGTIVWAYSKTSFEENMVGCLCVWAFVFLIRGFKKRRWHNFFLAGFFLGYSFFTRIPTCLYFFPMAFLLIQYILRKNVEDSLSVKKRLIHIASFIAPLILFSVFFLLYSYARSGHILGRLGHPDWDISRMLIFSVRQFGKNIWILLFSPGESIFLFIPLFLTFPFLLIRKLKNESTYFWTFLSCFALNFVFYLSWFGWSAEVGWGPRFLTHSFVFLMPLLAVGLSWWSELIEWRRKVAVFFFLVSILVQLLSIASPYFLEKQQVSEGQKHSFAWYPVIWMRAKNVTYLNARYLGIEKSVNRMFSDAEIEVLENDVNYHNFFFWTLKLGYSEKLKLYPLGFGFLLLGCLSAGFLVQLLFLIRRLQEP